MINFLMNSGKPVSPAVADVLYDTAKEMCRTRKERLKFKSAHCEGVMTTQGKRGSMGSVCGIEFSAKLSVNGADTDVAFIVTDQVLESPKGEWLGAENLEQVDALVKRTALHERPSRLN